MKALLPCSLPLMKREKGELLFYNWCCRPLVAGEKKTKPKKSVCLQSVGPGGLSGPVLSIDVCSSHCESNVTVKTLLVNLNS